MQKVLRSLFGAGASPKGKTDRSSQDNAPTIEDGSDNATRRHLVQVLLCDVMRRHGIPPPWVECQIQLVSSRSRGPGIYVRLVLKYWDERLVNYMYAFQRALMTDIERFEPKATEWLHGISWQLEMGDSCPFQTLPEKAFWGTGKPAAPAPYTVGRVAPGTSVPVGTPPKPAPQATAASAVPAAKPAMPPAGPAAPVVAAPAVTAAAKAPEEDDDPLKDLEALFVIRDQEIGKKAREEQPGFENTRPQ